jgi:crotonobetainyl-CoA:carnitine CoA-transferase CaiB-like acyl-CoA transferase
MEGFLDGYRIIDLTDQRGHLCGRILGDMGADVIKVEPPGGDPVRHIGPFYHDEPDPEKNLNWFFTNANKRGITLDLRLPGGKEIFKRLVERADLIIESFDPNYMEEIELGYSALCKIKPDIILTSLTPFGRNGPYAGYKVTDIVAEAMGGMVFALGDQDRPPVRISAPQTYFLGAQHAAVGSVSALYHRELTGEGQYVDVSMQEAVVFTLTYFLQTWEQLRVVRRRSGSEFIRPRLPSLETIVELGLEDLDPAELYGKLVELGAMEEFKTQWMFPCRDGYICLALQGAGGAPVKSSHAMVAWANEEGYALKIKDYKWETWDSGTTEQSQQDFVQNEIAPFLATKTKAELLEGAANRRILLAPVFTVADLPENPQISFRDYWQKIPHPELNDTLTYPGPSVKVDQCPQQISRKAPGIGEHNREIYGDELGLSSEKLDVYKSQGVI